MSKSKKLLLALTTLVGVLLMVWLMARLLVKMVSPSPTHLGVTEGQLAHCPQTPNCVSSQATRTDQFIEPILYTGELEAAQARLRHLITIRPRTVIIADEPGYLWIETTTPFMGFIDDTEFYFDEAAQVIQIRGAARLGRSDLGLNRARLEAIRQDFAQTEK